MKKVIVDYRINTEEKSSLITLGYEVILCPPSDILYDAVCGHPDMLMLIVDNNTILVHKDMEENFINKINSQGYNIMLSHSSLETSYPQNILLNAVNLNNIFIHNIKYTDKVLLDVIKDKKILNVKQGYTKCSTAIVSDKAVMTSDCSIAKVLKEQDLDVLLLPPGDIALPGLDYGFIGGCCGLLNDNRLAFYGDLNYYQYGKEVLEFLYKHNVKPVYLRKGKLIDRGSIFLLN